VWNNSYDNLIAKPHPINIKGHVRKAALDHVKENKISVPTNKTKPKQYQQAGLF